MCDLNKKIHLLEQELFARYPEAKGCKVRFTGNVTLYYTTRSFPPRIGIDPGEAPSGLDPSEGGFSHDISTYVRENPLSQHSLPNALACLEAEVAASHHKNAAE